MDRNSVITKYYEEERDNLVRRITFRAGSPEAAEDIVQEAFSLALKYWKAFEDAHKEFPMWFSAILNNALRLYKREERMYGMCEEFEEEEHDGLEMDLMHHDIQRKIREDMKMQNELHACVVDLYFNKQYKLSDIVKVTDESFHNVHKIVVRFKAECKAKYAIGG